MHASSSHPDTVKNAIPYGLGIRVKRICSEETDYNNRREDIKDQLIKWGYSKGTIENQLNYKYKGTMSVHCICILSNFYGK